MTSPPRPPPPARPPAEDAAAAPQRPLPWPLRLLLQLLAVLALALGIIGVFTPGLPTTVFILIAAWAAARSSPRLHGWLLRHRLFGPMIVNWRNGGTVSRRAKWSATAAMAVCIGVIFATASREWLAEAVSLLMLVILLWLWRRPEPRAAQDPR